MAAEFFYEFVPLDDGSPNVNGIVKTYEAGTTTPKVTYPTYADAIAGTNPNATTFSLAADGVVTFWMSGAYKIDVQDQFGVSIDGWPKDNINAAAVVATASQTGYVNKIINGDFSQWRRATTQNTAGYKSADRWQVGQLGSTQVTSQVAFALGASNSRYYSEIVVTSVPNANNFVLYNQNIEDVVALQGKTVTISFTAWSNAARNIAVELNQGFGSGGAPSAAVVGIGSQLVAITTTPTRYSVTIPIPSITGKNLGTTPNTSFTGVNFWLDAGANLNTRSASLGQQSGTFRFSDVQVQDGPEMTVFERRPPEIELALCQRYYDRDDFYIRGYNTAGAILSMNIPFRVTLRGTPVMTLSGAPGYFNGSGQATVVIGPGRVAIGFTVTVTGDAILNSSWEADAEI